MRSVSLGYTGTAPNPLTANLNLNKVYVIATSGSVFASELTTFCLRPYMNVIHIGEKYTRKVYRLPGQFMLMIVITIGHYHL